MTCAGLGLLLMPAWAAAGQTHIGRPVRIPAFERRVQSYLRTKQHALKIVPPIKARATAAQIQEHRLALAAAIRASRANARQGEIFSPEVRDAILQVIRSEVRGAEGIPARKAIMEDNPVKSGLKGSMALAVNAEYPQNVPLSTVPPAMLLRLPRLPEGLEFRFVGRDLILRDADANLVVDLLPGTLPSDINYALVTFHCRPPKCGGFS